ncbi:Rne/Rng family ribonuclease [Thermotoga profunda]|uniref:Rne/Rng family ribonuclease n=1 Tax=Thermotoga profunda TaxID=1508420 RepID=UPI000694D890|nr:Rne/Rng family ribonuclease [Thermotoga profunda]
MNQLVINLQEKRVNGAILSDGILQEFFTEENEFLSGNIYVGRIEKIITGLNAAFVDIGESKNAFLKLSDLSRQYLKQILGTEALKEGMKVLVQVKHDAIGSKGPQVTGKISLAGRFLVYFPLSRAKGVSKKVFDQKERERLKKLTKNLAKNEGIVVRTAAEFVPEEIIVEEFEELKREWAEILKDFKRARKSKLLRSEPTVADYIIRERLNKQIDEIYVNDELIYEKVKEACKGIPKKPLVNLIKEDLFDKLGIYNQLGQMQERTVDLPSGGYIALDSTEALTVFDVNSASFVAEKSHAELAYKINVEAAHEIARQLRLRNIGGIIIIDFIDMPSKDYYDRLMKELQNVVKGDSAHIELVGFTKLGLFEMTRKRKSPSIDQIMFTSCPVCKGTGKVISPLVIVKRVVNELSKIEDINQYSTVKVSLHQRLSGYVDKIKQSLSESIVKKVSFSFDSPNPGDFNLILSKKTS